MSILTLILVYCKRSNCIQRRELDPFGFTKNKTKQNTKYPYIYYDRFGKLYSFKLYPVLVQAF